MAKAPEPSWLRDRDLLAAWGFRILSLGFFGILLWNVTGYTKKIDDLSMQVPLLTNTVAALTDELKSEQAQIGKLWDHIFQDASSYGRQQKK